MNIHQALLLLTGDILAQRLAVQAEPATQPDGAATIGGAAVATESIMKRHDGPGRQGGVRGDRSIGGASCWSTVTQVGSRGVCAGCACIAWCSIVAIPLQ